MFGFLVTYTSWTLPLLLVCMVIFLIDKVYLKSINNDLMFVLWITVSVWSSAFIRGWERTEKELAYNFDTFGAENLEQELYDHQGEFVVDEITREVTKYCRFDTFWKRRMVSPNLTTRPLTCVLDGDPYLVPWDHNGCAKLPVLSQHQKLLR